MTSSKMIENNFLWLIQWFNIHCNGDWEHGCGVNIKTISNLVWAITIDLEITELENVEFQKVEIYRSPNDWISCHVEYFKFEGRCSSLNLYELIQIFRNWAERYPLLEEED